MKNKKISIIGTRAYPHNFVGTSGIEVYNEHVLSFFPETISTLIYVKSSYQKIILNKQTNENIQVIPLITVRSKVFESFFYSLFASFLTVFDGSSVVWYHGVGQALFSFLPRLFGKKIIITVHGEDWKRNKWTKVEQFLFGLIAHFVFLLPPNKTFVVGNSLQKKILLDFSVLACVANPGIDKNNEIRNTKLKNQFKVKRNQYLLYLGRIVPEKRLELLINSFLDLSKYHPKIKLVIAGGHGNTPGYETKIKEMIKGKPIIMTGYVFGNDKASLLMNTRALVMPSEIEGNSVSVAEALSMKKQVLISRNCLEKSFHELPGIFLFETEKEFKIELENVMKIEPEKVYLPQEIFNSYSWENTAKLYLREVPH